MTKLRRRKRLLAVYCFLNSGKVFLKEHTVPPKRGDTFHFSMPLNSSCHKTENEKMAWNFPTFCPEWEKRSTPKIPDRISGNFVIRFMMAIVKMISKLILFQVFDIASQTIK